MLPRLFFLALTLTVAQSLCAEPFWGSRVSQPVDTASQKLKPGQFIWKGNAIPAGPVVAMVNISEQRAYFYRNGILVGLSTVSTGRGRRSTPTGVFTVLGKYRYHRSRKYNNAPMPYTHHLTEDGVAMHAGNLPGYPASHGCIRLPSQFARYLFESSLVGMPVVVTKNQTTEVQPTTQAATLLPVDTTTAKAVKPANLAATEQFRWHPQAAADGPVSILLSKADQQVFVYRNGIEIGRARVSLTQPDKPLGTQAYLMQTAEGLGFNPFLITAPSPYWISVGIPGYADKGNTPLTPSAFESLRIPVDFVIALNAVLKRGTSLYITDASVLEQQINDVVQTAMLSTKLPPPPAQVQTIAAVEPAKILPAQTQATLPEPAKLSTEQPRTADLEPVKSAPAQPQTATALESVKAAPVQNIAEIETIKDDMKKIHTQVTDIKNELAEIEKKL